MQPSLVADPSTGQDALAALLVQSDLIALALARGDTLLFANAAFCRLFGRPGTQPGVSVPSLAIPAHRARVESLLRATDGEAACCMVEVPQSQGGTSAVELRSRAFVAGGESLCAISAQDVTERSRVAARLNLLAFSDPLTGLANRALFADRLRQAALETRRDGRRFALITLDLDRFKPVNDTHGHAVGDLVLQQVAMRLQGCLRVAETIARPGGDEFAILLLGVMRRPDVAAIADRILTVIRQPMQVGDVRLEIGATAGIALFPDHADTVERLVVAADAALFLAKQAGGDRYAWAAEGMSSGAIPPSIPWSVVYDLGVPEMDAQHARLAALLNDLAAALQNGANVKPAFQEFVRYAALHFADEEQLMAQASYADAAAHRDQHRQLIGDLAGLPLQGEGFSASLVLRYLQEWLFRHIDGPDRELAVALRAHTCAA